MQEPLPPRMNASVLFHYKLYGKPLVLAKEHNAHGKSAAPPGGNKIKLHRTIYFNSRQPFRDNKSELKGGCIFGRP